MTATFTNSDNVEFKVADEAVARLIKSLVYARESYEKELAKFQEALAKHPLTAFEYSGAIISAAATMQVHNRYVDHLCYEIEQREEEGKETLSLGEALALIDKDAARRLVDLAAHPRSSTSTMANHVSREETRAYARLAERGQRGW